MIAKDGVFVWILCPIDDRAITIKLSTCSWNLGTFLCLFRAFGKTAEARKSLPSITSRSQKTSMQVVDANFCFSLSLFACFDPRKRLSNLGETQTNLCTKEEAHSWTWPSDWSIWTLVSIVGRGDAANNERNCLWLFMIKNLRSIAVRYCALGYWKKENRAKLPNKLIESTGEVKMAKGWQVWLMRMKIATI